MSLQVGVRGRACTVLLSAVLLLFGVTARPAHAEVDLEIVAETIRETGYYVDPEAKYFQTDRALDVLRTAQDRAVPAYVAVLPATEQADQALAQLVRRHGGKGTFAVLAGTRFRASSNTLSSDVVMQAYTKAVAANKRRPDLALVQFVTALPAAPEVSPRPQPSTLADAQAARRAEPDEGFPFGYVIGGVVILAAAGGAAWWWLRRRKKPAATPAAPVAEPAAAAKPGDDASSAQPAEAAPAAQPTEAAPTAQSAEPAPAAQPAEAAAGTPPTVQATGSWSAAAAPQQDGTTPSQPPAEAAGGTREQGTAGTAEDATEPQRRDG